MSLAKVGSWLPVVFLLGGCAGHWIYYDTTQEGEIVLRKKRTSTETEAVDLWSYYEHGRLVWRDLSAVGLEFLSRQDQFPSNQGDPKNISPPRLVRDDRRGSFSPF